MINFISERDIIICNSLNYGASGVRTSLLSLKFCQVKSMKICYYLNVRYNITI